jgi:hypothetical protein
MSEGGRERRAGRESEGLDGGSIKLVYMANAASRVIYGSQGWRALSRRLIISRFHTYSSPIFQYPLFFSQSYTFPQPDRPRSCHRGGEGHPSGPPTARALDSHSSFLTSHFRLAASSNPAAIPGHVPSPFRFSTPPQPSPPFLPLLPLSPPLHPPVPPLPSIPRFPFRKYSLT